MRALRALAALGLAAAFLQAQATTDAQTSGYQHFVGALHNHSGYSDGWPGTKPADYFALGKAEGLDYMGSGEHSDNADVPITFSEGCLGEDLPKCVDTDLSTAKWEATQQQADEASTEDYTAFRGFEWTSDRFGHINVYFSRHDTNAKADGGYTAMETFWNWFDRSPGLDGGADGLATFNHPGAKSLDDGDPGFNWNDFEFVPSADHRMVGMEVFNDADEFGTTRGPAAGYFIHALDKGWHLGPVGAEDLHGNPGSRDDYGSPRWPKTVVLAEDNSVASLRAAMLERRFYALRRNDGLRIDFSADGRPMGSRLVKRPGETIQLTATTNRPDATTVEVVTSGGRVVSDGSGSVAWGPNDRYYFMRVKQGSEWMAYSSPVWVTQAPVTQGEWLAGDLHVHTCYSHDAYCPHEGDDNTGPDEFYTLSGNVEERFTEAALRGLDYLAITDHNDVRSVEHPGFGAHGVIAVPGYEKSLSGHAQMLGATKIYDVGSGAAAISALADELRADGGVFQINHPADGVVEPLDATCSKTDHLNWRYGFDVVPDTIEVWNIGFVLQPPLPSNTSNDDAMRYWECFLDRGHRVGATGGSDSHWISTAAVQGPGNPTTWAFAKHPTRAGILQALREGRTSVSLVPPTLGGLQLHLEADRDGDGLYEAVVGDEVPPGTAMRVRADGLPNAGFVDVRANGRTIVDRAELLPGAEITFTSPDEAGWVRATLYGPDMRQERAAVCDPLIGAHSTFCRNHIVMLAVTSPIYLSAPDVATSLTYTGPLTNVSSRVTLSARLATADGPLAGETVTFAYEGRTASGVTAADGVASVQVTFTKRGTQVVDIAYAGREGYLPSQTSATLIWLRP